MKKNKALQEFYEYWDGWHSKWQKLSHEQAVKHWKPIENSFYYFPEPYWGKPLNDVKCIFININPGGEDEYQKLSWRDRDGNNSQLVSTYLKYKKYSSCVRYLSFNKSYITTNYFYNKRVKWFKEILEIENSLDVNSFLFVDLIPWHTKNVNKEVTTNIDQNKKEVIENLMRIFNIAVEQKCQIIAKGKPIIKILKSLGYNSPEAQINDGIFQLSSFNILNFGEILHVISGGQGMNIPTNKAKINDRFKQILTQHA